jgi:hypothetical protein
MPRPREDCGRTGALVRRCTPQHSILMSSRQRRWALLHIDRPGRHIFVVVFMVSLSLSLTDLPRPNLAFHVNRTRDVASSTEFACSFENDGIPCRATVASAVPWHSLLIEQAISSSPVPQTEAAQSPPQCLSEPKRGATTPPRKLGGSKPSWPL